MEDEKKLPVEDEKDLKDLLTKIFDSQHMYVVGTDTPESKPNAQILVAFDMACKDCGQDVRPIVLHFHEKDREVLEWLAQDRKKDAGSIIRHLIQLEGNKRRTAASKRVRPRKA